tara:strand:+ start:447 stop:926 length:480 start_codon:yes stop_codon:yes gene_type:complete
MATHKQLTVEAVITERFMGRSASNDLATAFPESPIHKREMTDESVRQQYQEIVMDATINDGGHTFGEYNTSYAGAPNMDDVETGGGGLPASPYVPNVTSPGPGSLNPADMPEPPEGFGTRPSDTWGSGVGSQESPAISSARHSAHTIGEYLLGKATAEG